MKILETNRLVLHRLNVEDAEFIFELFNEPSWIEFIGEKHIKNIGDAKNYILNGPMKMYVEQGFGLFLVKLKTGESIGLCGLLKREGLDNVDLGFAFLPKYWRVGYAQESASAVINYGKSVHDLSQIVAITLSHNRSCIKLLGKLGFQCRNTIVHLEDEPRELELYGMEI